MKLYYSPDACSLTQHILLCQSTLSFTIERVDLKTKKTEHGHNFLAINPRGQVPTLELDNKIILTENIAIAQYIADTVPQAKLLAPVGNIERYQTLSWISYVATELHKGCGALLRPQVQSERDNGIKALQEKYAYLERHLSNHAYIATSEFTIADAYLYVLLRRWRQLLPNLSPYPSIDQYMQHIGELPAVKKALQQES